MTISPNSKVVREEDSMEEEMCLDQYWFSGPPMEQNSIENEKVLSGGLLL